MLTTFNIAERKKHVHTNQQDRLGFYLEHVLDRWAILNVSGFSFSPLCAIKMPSQLLSLFLSVNHAHSSERHPKTKNPCAAFLPITENSTFIELSL